MDSDADVEQVYRFWPKEQASRAVSGVPVNAACHVPVGKDDSRGKFHYIGPWDAPQAALDRHLDQKDTFTPVELPCGISGVAVR